MGAAGTGVWAGYTTLDANSLPFHSHNIWILTRGGKGNVWMPGQNNNCDLLADSVIEPTGSSWGHTHSISDPGHTHTIYDQGHTHGVSVGDVDNRPPFYALSFIMKLPV